MGLYTFLHLKQYHTKMESTNKNQGCIRIVLLVLLVGGISLKLYENYSFDRNAINGTWVYSTTSYNPFSLGGVINKGRYPVNYILKINNDDTYSLLYGSPNFEKFKSEGLIKKDFWMGVILTNFEPKSDHEKDYVMSNIKNRNGTIESFCLENEKSKGDCSMTFTKK
jgi:hypothetical protein